jgi:hypothetical protein
MQANKTFTLGSIGGKEIERTNALTLISDSREYFEYYKRGKPSQKVDISKVSYFLLMRSLELAFKSLLKVKDGVSTSYMKHHFGHDIVKLHSYCVKQNYSSSYDKETRLALKILNSYYKEKDFEYTKVGSKRLPSTSYIVAVIEDVHKELDEIFQTTGIKKYL